MKTPTYTPDWDSLQQYEIPTWYKDAKLGIFIHWGVYAVPAFASEWYPNMMYREDQPAYVPEDIRFTCKDNTLYAICLGWPGDTCHIRSLGSDAALNAADIESITMLGAGQHPLHWTQDHDGLHVQTPQAPPCKHAVTFKIRQSA